MKVLLVGINSSYLHTSLSVRTLCGYLNGRAGFSFKNENPLTGGFLCDFIELTVNQPYYDLLRKIMEKGPDVVLFSTYIWNGELCGKLIQDLHSLMPGLVLGAGGPEFGFSPERYFEKVPALDFIIKGEGEETLRELLAFLSLNSETGRDFKKKDFEDCDCTGNVKIENIKGLYLNRNGDIIFTGERDLMKDLSLIPFPYENLLELASGVFDSPCTGKKLYQNKDENQIARNTKEELNKIYYYESSRGCPYNCSYCISSLDKTVRFVPLEKVFEDLNVFLKAGVRLVKFVDRTFNINPERYLKIWDYIVRHHNGKTVFHFEIEAEFLSGEALDFLSSVPPGVMQFEIGIQSASEKTLKAVNRSADLKKLSCNIKRIPKTIHTHLDLIAGLPFEDLKTFGSSFDFVMSLKPDALQLGFLKVLPGTPMESYAKSGGWKWADSPVYETFSTPYMSHEDMFFLKDLEVVLDSLWNSGDFTCTLSYVLRFVSPWVFFCYVTRKAREAGVFARERRDGFWFDFLAGLVFAERGNGSFVEEGGIFSLDGENGGLVSGVFYELLRWDYIRGKKRNFPLWYTRRYSKERHRKLFEIYFNGQFSSIENENNGDTAGNSGTGYGGGVKAGISGSRIAGSAGRGKGTKNRGETVTAGGLLDMEETNKRFRLGFLHSDYDVFLFDVESPFPEDFPGTYEKLIIYNSR